MPGFDINQFRAQLQNDGARPNLFEVTLPFPASVVSAANLATSKLTFMARTSQLPGSIMGTVPVQYFGREVKVAGNRQFPEWTLTVINDEDFVVRRALEQWMNGINSHEGNLRNPAFSSTLGYTVDGKVTQYAKTGEAIKKYQFVGMFPTDIAPIDLDWGANDTIEEFVVSFQYQYWVDAASGIE